jgi:hypothetical protein
VADLKTKEANRWSKAGSGSLMRVAGASASTVNVNTEQKIIHEANDWLNHLLFFAGRSDPADVLPRRSLHKVDRIWTIRTDGTGLKKIHTRTMAMEIFGHEFWSGRRQNHLV